MLAANYSFGIERDVEQLKKNNLDFTKWTNPLEIQYAICSSQHTFELSKSVIMQVTARALDEDLLRLRPRQRHRGPSRLVSLPLPLSVPSNPSHPY